MRYSAPSSSVRLWTGVALGPVCLAAVALLAGCSGGHDAAAAAASGAGPAPTSLEIVRASPTAKPSAIDDAPEPGEAPTTRDATVTSERRNEVGELWLLDAAASSACAQAEFAMTAIDEGGDPTGHLRAAVAAAEPSKTTIVRDAAAVLAGSPASAADRADVVRFLTACTEGGYEL